MALASATTGFEQSKIYFRRSNAKEAVGKLKDALADMLFAADVYGDELMNEQEGAENAQMQLLSHQVRQPYMHVTCSADACALRWTALKSDSKGGYSKITKVQRQKEPKRSNHRSARRECP